MSATLDLKPYGINFVLRPGINNISDIRLTHLAEGISSSHEATINGIRYTDFIRLGAGTYGTTYRGIGPDDKYYAIKIIKDVFEAEHLVKECIQQIIIFKETKDLTNGPFAPALYSIGYDKSHKNAFIVSELMENTVWNLISRQTPVQNDVTVPEILKQVALQLDILQDKLQFNHRDLKTDNVMYKTNDDGTLNIKLIDFGFTCLTWHGMFIKGGEFFRYSSKCYRLQRDISQLITCILWYHKKNISSKLKTRLQTILNTQHGNKKQTFTRYLKGWLNSYKYLDRNNYVIAAGTPKSVFNEMNRFTKDIPFQGTNVTRKAPKKRSMIPIAAPAVPVGTCPPEKIMNPVTGRCVLRSGAIGRKLEKELEAPAVPAAPAVAEPAPAAPADDCPPGKIRNPKTRRCVNRSGAIGKKIV